jgi:hypothetical protein
MRELHARIAAQVREAEVSLGRALKLDPADLSRRLLLGGRFLCVHTQLPLTAECFLDHHSLRFALVAADARRALQTSCTNTVPAAPPPFPPFDGGSDDE